MTRFLLLSAAFTIATFSSAAAQNTPSTSPETSPFYSGITDEASLTRRVEGHLARANELLEALLAVSAARTPENTLRLYDDLMAEVLNARGPVRIVQELHPDAPMRATASLLLRRVDAFEGEVSLHRGVFAALAAIDTAGAMPEVRHYVRRSIAEYRRQGIDRDEATRGRLLRLQEELFTAEQEFRRNIQEGARLLQVGGVAELEGLPAEYIAAHPPDATGVITLTTDASDAGPVIAYGRNAELRRRMSIETGNVAFPANLSVLRRMLDLRYQIARTLGYADWATYHFADQMAAAPSTVSDFLDRVVSASASRVTNDWEELLARKRVDEPGASVIQSWEGPYYAEMVRRASYEYDSREILPYLPYDRVRDGMLDVTSRLFGFDYARVTDVPVWHPSVEVYEVSEQGRPAGRIYFDTHPRPGKGGAGAHVVPARFGLHGVPVPEIVLVARLPGAQRGDPGLMTPAAMTLFFHEFGHVIHGLAVGDREWILLQLERDFFEVPSQLLEEWSTDPSVLATFARHHQTNEPVPPALLQRMRRASELTRGIVVRNDALQAAFSLSLHSGDPAGMDPDEIYRDLLSVHLPHPYTLVEGVHPVASLLYVGNQNAASRYRYLWGEVITKDLFSQFDRSNLLGPAIARRYKETVLAPSGSKPAAELVQDFLGRPFDVTAWESWLNGRRQ